MLRAILGIILGVLAGGAAIFAIETLGHAMFPPSGSLNPSDPAQLATMMNEIPAGAKLMVLLAWFTGITMGGTVAMAISRRRKWTAWTVAVILFALAALTMVMIPHPVWMMAGAVMATIAGGAMSTRMVR